MKSYFIPNWIAQSTTLHYFSCSISKSLCTVFAMLGKVLKNDISAIFRQYLRAVSSLDGIPGTPPWSRE